jgi:hypothetical protein
MFSLSIILDNILAILSTADRKIFFAPNRPIFALRKARGLTAPQPVHPSTLFSVILKNTLFDAPQVLDNQHGNRLLWP